jgi:hypothetical protein
MPDTKLGDRFLNALLLPGDVLFYDKPSFFNRLIKLKRGEKYSHCEVFEGGDGTYASRNGVGVGRYYLSMEGLAAIYRMKDCKDFELEKGVAWFWSKDATGRYIVNGQGYDWVGLLSFSWAKFQGRENHKMFCSEFVVRFFEACGVPLFAADVDADAVSPGLITYSPKLFAVWLRADKKKK